jgi:hypothetical protein
VINYLEVSTVKWSVWGKEPVADPVVEGEGGVKVNMITSYCMQTNMQCAGQGASQSATEADEKKKPGCSQFAKDV